MFADVGITVHRDSTVTAVGRGGDGQVVATVTADDGRHHTVRAEQLLIATGRRAVTDGLGLQDMGVKLGGRGEVRVDEELGTDHPRIWAAGDVTGHPQFVYVAGAHGAVVVDNALHNAGRKLDYHHLPRVIFTSPSIAAAGMTEAEAQHHGYDCERRVLELDHVPRALVNRDTRGLVKLVADRDTGRLLGAHMLADGVGDVIATAVYHANPRHRHPPSLETSYTLSLILSV